MKKTIIYFLILINTFLIGNQNVFAIESEDIFSNEAIVVNLKTDKVLFSKNTNSEPVPIASLTKIMTYVLTVENISDINAKVVIPEGTKQEIADRGGSNAGLEDGYEYTILDLLYGLMLPSGCDAADVLAKYISNNDYEKFVKMMNEKAVELGMENTTFYNASGLKEGENNSLSTEQDLYKLAKYAFDLPYFKEIIGTEYYKVNGINEDVVNEKTVRNTNYMMGEYNGAEYYYQYSLGGKTGNTSDAGRCLISYAKKGDLEVVAITLGVPNEHSNYHLTDHKKLFEYVFEKFSKNITIDIGPKYKSIDVGEKIQIVATTSKKTKITWSSSDKTVATVNKNGVVTGRKMGQVKIIATTATGNIDYVYVSVGFSNGVDVKYSSGPSDSNGILGYGRIDWSIIKNSGIDFAIIRAGYGLNNSPENDPYFVENIKGAIDNDIKIMISFDGYASDEEYAKKEAEYLIQYLNDNISEYLNKIEYPIIYNLHNSSVSDVTTLTNILKVFKNEMKEEGYSTILELGRTKLSKMDLEEIIDSNIGLYIIWRPTIPDFQTQMYVLNGETEFYGDLWSYRTDAYFGEVGINKKISMTVMYNDYEKSLCIGKPILKALKDMISSLDFGDVIFRECSMSIGDGGKWEG